MITILYTFLTNILIPYLSKKILSEQTLDFIWNKATKKLLNDEKPFANFHSTDDFIKFYSNKKKELSLSEHFDGVGEITYKVISNNIVANIPFIRMVKSEDMSASAEDELDPIVVNVLVLCHTIETFEKLRDKINSSFVENALNFDL